jgi:hypothetical protein
LAADIAEKFDAKQREQANKELQNIKSNKPTPAKVPEPKPAVDPIKSNKPTPAKVPEPESKPAVAPKK